MLRPAIAMNGLREGASDQWGWLGSERSGAPSERSLSLPTFLYQESPLCGTRSWISQAGFHCDQAASFGFSWSGDQIDFHLGKPAWKANAHSTRSFSGDQIGFHLDEPRWKADVSYSPARHPPCVDGSHVWSPEPQPPVSIFRTPPSLPRW